MIIDEKKYQSMIVERRALTSCLRDRQSVIAALPFITARLSELCFEGRILSKHGGTLDFACLAKMVNDDRKALRMAPKGMRNTQSQECFELLKELAQRHDQMFFQFDIAYTG